jgi:OTT_1508-like deaminase
MDAWCQPKTVSRRSALLRMIRVLLEQFTHITTPEITIRGRLVKMDTEPSLTEIVSALTQVFATSSTLANSEYLRSFLMHQDSIFRNSSHALLHVLRVVGYYYSGLAEAIQAVRALRGGRNSAREVPIDNPVPVEYGVSTWVTVVQSECLKRKAKRCLVTQEFISPNCSVKRLAVQTWNTNSVHCELALVCDLSTVGIVPRHIAVSKRCCLLCHAFLAKLRESDKKYAKMIMPRTLGQIWSGGNHNYCKFSAVLRPISRVQTAD